MSAKRLELNLEKMLIGTIEMVYFEKVEDVWETGLRSIVELLPRTMQISLVKIRTLQFPLGWGAHIHIFVFTDSKNNRFQKKLLVQNTNIWICLPPQLPSWIRHCKEKVWHLVLVEKGLLINARYFVELKCGVRFESNTFSFNFIIKLYYS